MAAAAALRSGAARKDTEQRSAPAASATNSAAARSSNPQRSAILPAGAKSSAVVELTSSSFAPSAAVADEIKEAGSKGLDVRVIAKGFTQEGIIKIRKDSKDKFDSVSRGFMPLLNPWTDKLGGLYVGFIVENSVIKDGYAGLKPKGGGKNDWLQNLKKDPALLGGLGLRIDSLPKSVNSFDGAKMSLGVTGAKIQVGGYVDASFDLSLENMAAPKIAGSANIDVKGAVKGELKLASDGEKLQGAVSLAVDYKSFSGSIKVEYKPDGSIDIFGKAGYSGDKLSGEISFVSTDFDSANKFARDAITAAGGKENVQNAAAPIAVPAAKEGSKKRALAATGQLAFNLTKWFAGTVTVVVDGKGALTVIGKIAPPGEIIIFNQRDWDKELFKFEAKAYYGIPVVGNLNLFANISLHALAKLGPAKFYNIEILGTYSTDPEIQKNIQISGSFNVSAYAGLRLRAEGGAGIEILSHDLKFGVGLQADVGVKAYVDARPTIGYREPGEFYISGTLDLVAQPVLGLGGDFFIAIETPWWSPLSDDRWTWPLFSKEWPLGDPIGISATMKEYVYGSGKTPEIELKPPEFDPSKFMTNMVDDKLPGKSGGQGSGKGAYKEDGSVAKPMGTPKKPAPPKVDPKSAGKGGKKLGSGKSGKPDANAANDAKSTAILKNAAKPLEALKGKPAMPRGALDKELASIIGHVNGIAFIVASAEGKWPITPKAGKISGPVVEVKASKRVEWWKDRQPFKGDDKASHSLFFVGEGKAAKLTVASTPTSVDTWLTKIPEKSLDASAKRALSAAQKLVKEEVHQTALTLEAANAVPPEATKKLHSELERLAKYLAVLAPYHPDAPHTDAKNLRITPAVEVQFKIGDKLQSKPGPDFQDVAAVRKEYQRQLALQQGMLNPMTVARWRQNRLEFSLRKIPDKPGGKEKSGRDPESATDQQNLRNRVRVELAQRLGLGRNSDQIFPSLGAYERLWVRQQFDALPAISTYRTDGFPVGIAEAKANDWMRTQHALHSPDQIAGGSRDLLNQGLTGMGSGRVNSSIGSQWGNNKIADLEAGVASRMKESWPDGPPKPITSITDIGRVMMNVTLSV